jgi:hypothetical protein
MSIENLSSENRNYYLSRSVRRCSFCRQTGHNITRCDNNRLIEFELACEYGVINIETEDMFKEWLIQNYSDSLDLLKTFAISKLRVNSRTTLTECIELITRYIFNTYKNQTVEQLVDENVITEEDIEAELLRVLNGLRNIGQPQTVEENEDHFINNTRREYMEYITDVLILTMLNNMLSQNIEETIPPRKLNIVSDVDVTMLDDKNIYPDCSICLEKVDSCKIVKLNCKHEFCNECIIKTIKTENRNTLCCALCRAEISNITSRCENVQNEISNAIA